MKYVNLAANELEHVCLNSWKYSNYIKYVLKLGLSSESLISCPCRHGISRALKDLEFTTRWDKRKKGGNVALLIVIKKSMTKIATQAISEGE